MRIMPNHATELRPSSEAKILSSPVPLEHHATLKSELVTIQTESSEAKCSGAANHATNHFQRTKPSSD